MIVKGVVVCAKGGPRREPAKTLQDSSRARSPPTIPPRDRVRGRAAAKRHRQAANGSGSGTGADASSQPLDIAIIGGGPGGPLPGDPGQAAQPSPQDRGWERNAADDTFGFGVVSQMNGWAA